MSCANTFETQLFRHVGVCIGLFAALFPVSFAYAGGRAPLASHTAAILDTDSPVKLVTFESVTPSKSYYEKSFSGSDMNLYNHYQLTHAAGANGLRAQASRYEFQRAQALWSLREESDVRNGIAGATLRDRMHRMTNAYFQSDERPVTTRKAMALTEDVRASSVRLSEGNSGATSLLFGYDYFTDETHLGLSTERWMGRVLINSAFSGLATQTRIECVGRYSDTAADITVGYLIEKNTLDASLTRRVHKSITAQIGTRQAMSADYQQVDLRFFFDL